MMKNVGLILDKILAIAKDVKIWMRVLVLVITGFAGAILFSRTKIKDCTVCEGQKAELVNALIQLKTMADVPVTPSTLVVTSSSFYTPTMFIDSGLMSDTTPRQRRIMRYIDSVLYKVRQDSVRQYRYKKGGDPTP